MSSELLIKFFGLFLGVLTRSFLPWIRKLKEGEIQSFSRRYLISAIASLILGLIVTLLIFPQFSSAPLDSSFEAYFKLFCLAFGFGFGFDSILKEASQWPLMYKKRKEAINSRGATLGRKNA